MRGGGAFLHALIKYSLFHIADFFLFPVCPPLYLHICFFGCWYPFLVCLSDSFLVCQWLRSCYSVLVKREPHIIMQIKLTLICPFYGQRSKSSNFKEIIFCLYAQFLSLHFCTVCPGSSNTFHTYYMKCVTTYWTHSTYFSSLPWSRV